MLKSVPSQFFYSASDQDNQTIGTMLYFCPGDKFLQYMHEFPQFQVSIRERATLRRAFWRKIELEFESQLALEFEAAGIIDADDETDEWMLDPLHKVDYRAWMRGEVPLEREEEDIDFNEVRKICVENTIRTILDDLKFNPIKP